MSADKHAQLAEKATRLKKAWLLTVAMEGAGPNLSPHDLCVPRYGLFKHGQLKEHVRDLETDFYNFSKRVVSDLKKSNMSVTVKWFADTYDMWISSGGGCYDLGRVHEFEARFGRLGYRDVMECPPYAQLLLQGYNVGMAVRHPEYHLATDLALLYNLYLDSTRIVDTAEPEQSLGRSVILTCYNLLESFTSGLATAYLLENLDVPEDVVKKMKQNRASLAKRFRTFPKLVTGRDSGMSMDKEPLKSLFGTCQQRRDSFVHCEPGPEPSKYGYIKEFNFHDITLANVKETVDLTDEAICLAWKHVHGKERPQWLPCREANGRFPRIEVSLRLGGEKS